jgi:hypothetical protein
MNISEAYDFFNKLLTETDNNAEIKVYKKFIEIFNNLGSREFSEEQKKSIEAKIDALKLGAVSDVKVKQYKMRLNDFKKFVKEEFSLIPKGYYAALGIATGGSIGVMLGVLPTFWKLTFGIETEFQRSLGVALGAAIGTAVGLFIGKFMDYSAEKENRVLG